jgi:hypothetical protein
MIFELFPLTLKKKLNMTLKRDKFVYNYWYRELFLSIDLTFQLKNIRSYTSDPALVASYDTQWDVEDLFLNRFLTADGRIHLPIQLSKVYLLTNLFSPYVFTFLLFF